MVKKKHSFESECTKGCTKCSLLFLYDIFSKIDMIYCTHFSLSTILTNISWNSLILFVIFNFSCNMIGWWCLPFQPHFQVTHTAHIQKYWTILPQHLYLVSSKIHFVDFYARNGNVAITYSCTWYSSVSLFYIILSSTKDYLSTLFAIRTM